ncbi:SpoIIE family protein phosphatase [bacterium AH-315-B15]|nr:SpoIIE family protein phosphatase [bacterium AH-315-B15]
MIARFITYLILLFLLSPTSTSALAFEAPNTDLTDSLHNKQGFHHEYYKSGQLKKKTFFIDNIPQGAETGYYKNGGVRYTIIWKDSIPDGFYQIYYQKGAVKETGIWRNEHNVGSQIEYYESGTVKLSSTHSQNGYLDGAQIEYFENEIIKKITMWEDSTKNGFAVVFDENGNHKGIQRYGWAKEIEHAENSDLFNAIVSYVEDQNQLIFTRDSLATAHRDLELEEAAAQSELKADAEQRLYLYAGLGLLLIFGIFMWNRFRVTHRQKGIIEEQKAEVDEQKAVIEESHKEITDSIVYAKRIQSAILPQAKLVKEYLDESFILYKPKDVVAGDFYWIQSFGPSTPSAGSGASGVLFAAADCTGHGVPGAMISVLCNAGLNRSVREYGLTDPGAILDQCRQIVIQEFDKSEEDVKDGMDIALVSLARSQESEVRSVLKYAGANNPLWIVRNGEVVETKGHKEPIGKFHVLTPYPTHTVDLQKGDAVYIFSDGYVDQFGGERGKKFKSKAFRELLISIQDQSMDEQKVSLDAAFEEWRGEYEQVDDVCVIGVRV